MGTSSPSGGEQPGWAAWAPSAGWLRRRAGRHQLRLSGGWWRRCGVPPDRGGGTAGPAPRLRRRAEHRVSAGAAGLTRARPASPATAPEVAAPAERGSPAAALAQEAAGPARGRAGRRRRRRRGAAAARAARPGAWKVAAAVEAGSVAAGAAAATPLWSVRGPTGDWRGRRLWRRWWRRRRPQHRDRWSRGHRWVWRRRWNGRRGRWRRRHGRRDLQHAG